MGESSPAPAANGGQTSDDERTTHAAASQPRLRLVGREPASALPNVLSTLIGREREIAAVHDLLLRPGVALLTLTGPGGVGKTRLAVAAARAATDAFDEIVFIDLSTVHDPAQVLPTVARTLGIRDPEGDQFDRLGTFFLNRRVLLVLDNVEQVAAAASSIARLAANHPELKVLLTSRVVLRVTGERAYPVRPLALPEADGARFDDILACEAVRLFSERASAVDPDFTPTPETAAAIVEICRRVDGLPLAIELAAARMGHLSPTRLAARLGRRLPLLTAGSRDAPDRQRTMREAVRWSYELLSPAEQRLFRRLAVWDGGFTLDVAESVAGADLTTDVLDSVAVLVDASLMQRVEDEAADARYAMLETIREFGLEQLVANGEDDDARAIHAAHYRVLSENAAVGLAGADRGAWLRRLERESANLQTALEQLERTGDHRATLRMAGALWRFWYQRGTPAAGSAYLEAALADRTPTVDAAIRARGLLGAGVLAWQRGDYDRSEAWLTEALAHYETSGDDAGRAWTLNYLACLYSDQRLDERTERYHDESLRIFREIGDHVGAAQAAGNLGELALEEGRFDVAADRLRAALASQQALGDVAGAARVLTYLGHALVANGDLIGAAESLTAALTALREITFVQVMPDALRGIAALVAARGDAQQAARLYGAEDALRATLGIQLQPVLRARHDGAIADVRGRLGEEAFLTAWRSGRTLSVDEMLASAETATEQSAIADESPVLPAAAVRYGLTPREVEVLRLLARRLTDREIADTLFVSQHTVGRHVQNILGKLGVSNRREVAALAAREGLT